MRNFIIQLFFTLFLQISFGQLIPGINTTPTAWNLSGNVVASGTQFLGTTNTVGLIFRTNNLNRVKIDSLTGNVGINTNNPLVKIDINSTDAIRIPSGTTGQAPTGAVGMLRHNSTTSTIQAVISGTTFVDLLTSVSPSTGWNLTGNTVTAGIQFLGSVNTVGLIFKTNNLVRAKIDSLTGNINIGGGLTIPLVKLEVNSTDAIKIPVGTTAQVPTGVVGYIRMNTTLTRFTGVRSGSTYLNFLQETDAAVDVNQTAMLQETVTGITGSTVTFTGSIVAGTHASRVHVFKNGSLLLLTTDYTVSTTVPLVLTVVVAATAPDRYTFQVY